jgi:hypothetical protein
LGNLGKARLVVSTNTAGALGRPRNGRPKLNYATRANSIASQRASRLSEIESLRRDGLASESFVDKAQTLLTQRWSKATWRSREQLLRAVDWLLRMERARQNGLAIQDRHR